MLASTEPAATTATSAATRAKTRSNQLILFSRSAIVLPMGQANVSRSSCLLYCWSRAAPIATLRSFTSTALTSLAFSAACPVMLAGGELPRVMPQSAGQANPVDQRPGERPVGPRTERHAEQHVFQAGEGGEQVEGLKNVAQGHRPHAVPARFIERGEVLACEPDTA